MRRRLRSLLLLQVFWTPTLHSSSSPMSFVPNPQADTSIGLACEIRLTVPCTTYSKGSGLYPLPSHENIGTFSQDKARYCKGLIRLSAGTRHSLIGTQSEVCFLPNISKPMMNIQVTLSQGRPWLLCTRAQRPVL